MTRRFSLFESETDVLYAEGDAANLEFYVCCQGTIIRLGSTSPSLLLDEIEDLDEIPDEAFFSNTDVVVLRRFASLMDVVTEGSGYFILNKSIFFVDELSGNLHIRSRRDNTEIEIALSVSPTEVAAKLIQYGFISTML